MMGRLMIAISGAYFMFGSTMRFPAIFLSVVLSIGYFGAAQAEECGTCILYGKDHAFAMTAPKGWVLDNKSGVGQGLHQVFYPLGYSWASSPVIAYSRARSKDAQIQTIEDQVADTLNDFKSTSPNIKAEAVEAIPLKEGKIAKVFHFTGDQWNNYEAVAYIDEKKTINFVVLSSRSKEWFDKAQTAFRGIMESYTFISDSVEIKK